MAVPPVSLRATLSSTACWAASRAVVTWAIVPRRSAYEMSFLSSNLVQRMGAKGCRVQKEGWTLKQPARRDVLRWEIRLLKSAGGDATRTSGLS